MKIKPDGTFSAGVGVFTEANWLVNMRSSRNYNLSKNQCFIEENYFKFGVIVSHWGENSQQKQQKHFFVHSKRISAKV